jgi:oligopeptide/dipeptide ABC transporter ATP-binding protein
VIQNPKHPYTQALIDALPKFGHCGEITHYGTLLGVEREVPKGTSCPFFIRCKKAHPKKCDLEKPPLAPIDTDHLVACFYAVPGAESAPESKECYFGI